MRLYNNKTARRRSEDILLTAVSFNNMFRRSEVSVSGTLAEFYPGIYNYIPDLFFAFYTA